MRSVGHQFLTLVVSLDFLRFPLRSIPLRCLLLIMIITAQDNYRDWIVWVSGMVQTIVYADFFYYYIKARTLGKKMSLPV